MPKPFVNAQPIVIRFRVHICDIVDVYCVYQCSNDARAERWRLRLHGWWLRQCHHYGIHALLTEYLHYLSLCHLLEWSTTSCNQFSAKTLVNIVVFTVHFSHVR